MCVFSDNRNNLDSNCTPTKRRGSWSGTLDPRTALVKTPSLPSLVTQWTCIRCLLHNSCRAAPICAACGASSSISQTEATQIGVRKCRRLNTRKNNVPKPAARLNLVTKVTTGSVTRVLDTSTNNVRISVRDRNIKTEGEFNFCNYTVHKYK